MAGIVYLVGAGPGDPKLITVRGRECLGRADVVFYDALANAALLDHAPAGAERVYVGKCAGKHSVPQDQLNDRLVEAARSGQTIVRLKGGDPFIFGRGGEEAEALLEAGLSFEIVPGVTSPIAASAYAGIPLTHRRCASSVAFVTGHEDPTKDSRSVDWQGLARSVDTIVVLMGMGRLGEIADQLHQGGRSAETLVAVVQWGTTPRQRTVVGTLSTIADDVQRAGIGAPAITIVGDVVNIRETLRWFDVKPLFGRRVLVTRARAQASKLVELLTDAGADVVQCPTIRCEAIADNAPLVSAARAIGSFDWVLFASANAVDALWSALADLGLDSRALAGVKVGAMGPATAEALVTRGVTADLVPSETRSEGLLDELGDVGGLRILLPRAEDGRDVLRRGLVEAGADVVSIAAYRTVAVEDNVDEVVALLSLGHLDAITLTSASTVSNLISALPSESSREAMRKTCVAVIGPTTRAAAESHGLRVTIEAAEASVEALTDALIAYFATVEAASP